MAARRNRGLIDLTLGETVHLTARLTPDQDRQVKELMALLNADKTTVIRMAISRLYDAVKGKKP